MGFFPILKGMFQQEKYEQKTLSEPESLGQMLSHAKATAQLLGCSMSAKK